MWDTWPKIWGRLSKTLGSGADFKIPSTKMAKNGKIKPFLMPIYAIIEYKNVQG